MTIEQEESLTGQGESIDNLLNPPTARAGIEAYLDEVRKACGAKLSTDDIRNKIIKGSTFN